MQFFYKYFGRNNHENDKGEMFVKCPFPHTDEHGNPYYESNPSAHINTERSVFHCKVCGQGMSEALFIARLQGIGYKEALSLLAMMEEKADDTWKEEREKFVNSEAAISLCKHLGILEVASDLQIGYEGKGISFPVFVYGELLDVRNYVPDRETKDGRKLKVVSRKGAKPLILPFDLWIDEEEKATVLCAGEKDMSIARKHSYNAITFTGGERSIPKLFKASFRGKKVYICYDNDQAGLEGAYAVAVHLKEWGAIPYVVTGHYEVCVERGEDIHDFFMKYNKTKEDFDAILESTPVFTEEAYQEERAKVIPLVTVNEAMDPRYKGKFISSNVSVVSVYDSVYRIPDYVEFEKYAVDDGDMYKGQKKSWAIGEDNIRDILHLCETVTSDEKLYKNLLKLARLTKEKSISSKTLSSMNVYKATVIDTIESSTDTDYKPTPLTVYILGQQLMPGQKYQITFKSVPHPTDQHIVGIVQSAEQSAKSIARFKVTEDIAASLSPFKKREGQSVADKVNELLEQAKFYTGVATRPDIAIPTELFFHTPLTFKFRDQYIRGTLDVMIIGDERTGKSNTAKRLIELYELGVITSLKTTSEGGLIGGSHGSASGGYKTMLGVLPINHRGAVVLEEFSGGGRDLISKLTEIRSSQRVRIGRVNGTLEANAQVRMLSISNAATKHGISTPLRNFPHGIDVLQHLIGASEDISRYDLFALIPASIDYTSPLERPTVRPISKESYMNRIRWIWSRTPEQVVITDEVMEYIFKTQTELNQKFDTDIKIFGPETWMKISRIAIAAAGMLCSTDETGENIIVTNEHVSWAKGILKATYDNDTFRLGAYVEARRRYTEFDDQAVQWLQRIYNNHAVLLQQLQMESDTTRFQLEAVSGLDRKEFNRVINDLVKGYFLELKGDRMIPTRRFREAMKHMGDIYLKGAGLD